MGNLARSDWLVRNVTRSDWLARNLSRSDWLARNLTRPGWLVANLTISLVCISNFHLPLAFFTRAEILRVLPSCPRRLEIQDRKGNGILFCRNLKERARRESNCNLFRRGIWKGLLFTLPTAQEIVEYWKAETLYLPSLKGL